MINSSYPDAKKAEWRALLEQYAAVSGFRTGLVVDVQEILSIEKQLDLLAIEAARTEFLDEAVAEEEATEIEEPVPVFQAQVYFGDLGIVLVDIDAVAWAAPYVNENRRGAAPKTVADVLRPGDIVRFRLSESGELRLGQVPEVQGALTSLDPLDGAISALSGGFDFSLSKYNRATQSKRQPGSAFKPFVFLAGLENGLRPETKFADRPITIDDWSPKNYAGKYRGRITFAQALAYSSNSVAVQVSERVGRNRVIDAARRLGLTSHIPNHPSMALGTAEVGLMEMTAAYAALANKGIGAMPHGILEVRDGRDRVLYRRHGSGRGQVARPWHVAELGQMLARTIRIGTGRNARLGRPAAGKTGTSQDYRDAWFLGYTSHLVAGVWLGNDNGAPMNRVTGGGAPARLWRDFMVAAHKDLPARPLKQAKGRASAGQRGETFFDKLWKSLGSGGSSNPRNNSNDQNNRDHP